MFKWINPKIYALQEKLASAEMQVVSLEVDNSWLKNQLNEAKEENRRLLEKIFSITGISERIPLTGNAASSQVPIQSGRRTWAQQREQLEADARKKHWEDIKRQKEAEIEKLESEVGLKVEDKEDASKIS